ncbi:MAG: nuclear transport factor 2 family protein [Gemmatimonadales bacterium]|nr:nuclear transport factor 2 family protein [Gemmatimonadales bacterium]
MKRWALAVGLSLALAAPATAQDAGALDRSLDQLVADYIGLYTKETLPRWRTLFLPTFSVASTTAEGGVSTRGLEQFYAAQERGFATSRSMGERLENVRVERRGRMASVWADFVFWQDGEASRGRLVLLAIHQREGWRFHSLMFSYHD